MVAARNKANTISTAESLYLSPMQLSDPFSSRKQCHRHPAVHVALDNLGKFRRQESYGHHKSSSCTDAFGLQCDAESSQSFFSDTSSLSLEEFAISEGLAYEANALGLSLLSEWEPIQFEPSEDLPSVAGIRLTN